MLLNSVSTRIPQDGDIFLVLHLRRLSLGKLIWSQWRCDLESGSQLSSWASNHHSNLPLRLSHLILTSPSKAGVTSPFYRWGNYTVSKQQGSDVRPGWSSSKLLFHSLKLRTLCFISETWGSALLAMPEMNKKMWLWMFLLSSVKWVNWKYHTSTSEVRKNKVIPGTNPKRAINV